MFCEIPWRKHLCGDWVAEDRQLLSHWNLLTSNRFFPFRLSLCSAIHCTQPLSPGTWYTVIRLTTCPACLLEKQKDPSQMKNADYSTSSGQTRNCGTRCQQLLAACAGNFIHCSSKQISLLLVGAFLDNCARWKKDPFTLWQRESCQRLVRNEDPRELSSQTVEFAGRVIWNVTKSWEQL